MTATTMTQDHIDRATAYLAKGKPVTTGDIATHLKAHPVIAASVMRELHKRRLVRRAEKRLHDQIWEPHPPYFKRRGVDEQFAADLMHQHTPPRRHLAKWGPRVGKTPERVALLKYFDGGKPGGAPAFSELGLSKRKYCGHMSVLSLAGLVHREARKKYESFYETTDAGREILRKWGEA